MTESGKFMQLVTGFICVSIVSLSCLVFLCMQYFYGILNYDYLFIGNVPFCNMMDDVRKMVRSSVDNLLYILVAQIIGVLYVALAFAVDPTGLQGPPGVGAVMKRITPPCEKLITYSSSLSVSLSVVLV